MNNRNLIFIGGPTAIGKTTIAIKLAKTLSTEIISCDSRQFYNEMKIGTSPPSKKEMSLVKHHFIQDRSIETPLNVGAYQKESISKIYNILDDNKNVILVGGSGLYADSILFGLDDFPNTTNLTVNKLNDIYNNDGIDSLQKQLKKMDYESYKTIDINNHRRVIRVLSVCIDSGLKYSSFLSKEKKIRKFQSQIYILCEERIKIYDKINERVDKMVENGLEKEAKSLYKFKDSKIFETVGYKEWILYWNRTLSKKKTIEEIKKNTRRYAKRQITWFKKYKKATWLKPNEAIDKILKNYK
ncbi:MAG: tRNA (adenosine(37)-N6)-dimethylallyltransferase MiaA [Candidatus Marivariicella sp.]